MSQLEKVSRGKSAGFDCMTIEAIQLGSEEVAAALARFSGLVSDERSDTSQDRRTVIVVLLTKQRGGGSLFEHLRPIMLLPVTGKLYSRCLLNRLEQSIGPVSDFTFGSRSIYEATDLTMCMLRLQSQRNEWRAPWNFLKAEPTA